MFLLVEVRAQSSPEPFSWNIFEPDYSFRHFTTDDGLPVNSIQDILFNSNGFLYIATFDGLAQFDGNRFVNYNTANSPGLKRNRIKKMLPGPSNRIWLVDTSYNLYEFQHGVFNLLSDSIFGGVSVYEMHVTGKDSLHIFTDKGYFLKNGYSEFIRLDSVSYISPTELQETILTKDLTQYPFEEGLMLQNEIIVQPQDTLRKIVQDAEGSFWIKSPDRGIYQVYSNQMVSVGQNVHKGFGNIYGMFEEPDGSVWINSFDNGVLNIRNGSLKAWSIDEQNLPENAMRTTVTLNSGETYVGGTGGIWKLEDDKWRDLKIKGAVPIGVDVLFQDKKERFWIGSNRGLYRIEEDSIYSFSDQRRNTVQQAKAILDFFDKGLLFATTGQGIALLGNDDNFYYIDSKDGLSSDLIRDVYAPSEDTLWVVTEDLGLNRVILEGNFRVQSVKQFTMFDGLVDNSLHRLIEDPLGYFWINSNRGIMRVHKTDLNNYADELSSLLQIQSFTQKSGLQSSEGNGGAQYAGLLTSSGHLLFPNQAGVVLTRPEWHLESQSSIIFEPVAEYINYLDDEDQLAGEETIILPKDIRDFEIKLTLPTFKEPDKLLLQYKLDGFNQGWQKTGTERHAIFTNVPAGTYTFLMRGKTQGQSRFVESSILITVPLQFHETIWFYIGLVIFGIGILTGGYRIRVGNLKARERKLQQRVDEQTEALQKAAEQKNRFFTGITHELKTPLSLIVGPLDDMAEQPESITPEIVKNRLPLMQRNSHRLKHLVDQILDVSKLNADAIRLTLQPVNLEELTRQISGQFQSWLEQEELTLILNSEPIEGQIYMDTEAWERIVINLLSNAIKFSPKGGAIEMKIVNQKDSVQVSIRDEGAGIPVEHQQKIFEYLYQAEGAKAAEGTGIGLYLVKGLVEEMGGAIEVQSEAERGAEFIITLKKGTSHFDPVHTIHHDHKSLKVHKHSYKEGKDSITQSESDSGLQDFEQILVVEDNLDFRNYLKSSLQEKYSVLTATNGYDALEVLKNETPDLIISDVMMPKMGGLEFVNTLRKKNQFRHLPVIFLSAKNHDVDVETGLSTGADIYLTKPIRSKMLHSQIEAVLRRERVLRNQEFLHREKEEPELMRQVREIIYRQLANPSLTTSMLADALFISRAKLYSEWKKVNDVTLNDFIRQLRLNEGKILLREKGFNVQETARAVGYSDANYFSTSFKKEFGISPSEIH